MLLEKPIVRKCGRRMPDGTEKELWLVYCGTDSAGTVVKYYRSDESAARTLAHDMALRIRKVGNAINELSAAQLYDAAEAFRILCENKMGITLTECARLCVDDMIKKREEKNVSIIKVYEMFIKRYNEDNQHFKNINTFMRNLIGKFGENRSISDLDKTFCESVLSKYKTDSTFNLMRSYLSVFVKWSEKNGYISEASMKDVLNIETKRIPYKRPVFLHSDVVEKIFRWSEAQDKAMFIVPKFALSFFAGIRSAEIDRMGWEDIHFDTLEISVETPKGGIDTLPRSVLMSENLVKWLEKYRPEEGREGEVQLCYSSDGMKRWKHKLFAETGIDLINDDLRNVGRHTFCTMHFARWRNFSSTQAQLGHYTDSPTFVRNYNNATSQTDAKKFWNIFPS